jgi:DNA polymerase-3 subunit epsilon
MVTAEQLNRYQDLLSNLPPQADIVFVDCETTGLDAYKHEIIEVAAIRVDAVTLKPKEQMHRRIRPTKPVPQESIKWNNYSPQLWRDSVPDIEALAILRPLVQGARWAGSNPSFDRRFLDAAAKRCNVNRLEPNTFRQIDISGMVEPLIRAGLIPRSGVDEIARFFGIVPKERHTATGDVETEIAIYRALMHFYIPSILAAIDSKA